MQYNLNKEICTRAVERINGHSTVESKAKKFGMTRKLLTNYVILSQILQMDAMGVKQIAYQKSKQLASFIYFEKMYGQ